MTENGYGKRTPLSEYLVHSEDGSTRPQGRGGKGRRDIQTTARNGSVVALRRIISADDLMLITVNGMIVRINAQTIRQTKRASSGVRVISLSAGDKLAGVARVKDEDDRQTTTSPGSAESPDPSDGPDSTPGEDD